MVFSLQIYACTYKIKAISEEGQPNSITNSYYPNTSQETEQSCQLCVKFHAQTQTCHLLGHMTWFSKKSDHGPLKTFISQSHTVLARQDAEPPLVTSSKASCLRWGPDADRNLVPGSPLHQQGQRSFWNKPSGFQNIKPVPQTAHV